MYKGAGLGPNDVDVFNPYPSGRIRTRPGSMNEKLPANLRER